MWTHLLQTKHLHLNKHQTQNTWTLLILSSCPSLSITAMLSCSGRPSFSQLRVGGGRPVAIHSSSSTLSTATSCLSGDEEPDILGGSMGKYIISVCSTYIRFKYLYQILCINRSTAFPQETLHTLANVLCPLNKLCILSFSSQNACDPMQMLHSKYNVWQGNTKVLREKAKALKHNFYLQSQFFLTITISL